MCMYFNDNLFMRQTLLITVLAAIRTSEICLHFRDGADREQVENLRQPCSISGLS